MKLHAKITDLLLAIPIIIIGAGVTLWEWIKK